MIVRGGTHTAAGGSNRMCNSVDRGLAIRFGPRGESGSVFRSSHTERAGSIRPPSSFLCPPLPLAPWLAYRSCDLKIEAKSPVVDPMNRETPEFGTPFFLMIPMS